MRAWILLVLRGYAQVFFSTNPWTGALFLLATFADPEQGLLGLLALVLAQGLARGVGLDRDLVGQGYFAFNGLLVGLTLGATYRVDGPSLLLLLAAVALCVALAATLHGLFLRLLGTPPLCTPFVLTSWVVLTAGARFPALTYTVSPYEIEALADCLPASLELFLRSLGATLFQFNVPAGILIGLGLALFSRHALLLAGIGVASAAALHAGLGSTGASWLGFNAALTAIALGGIWVVPGFDALVLAGLGGALSAVVTTASQAALEPLGLPVLAFPFLATTTAVLYALQQRVATGPFCTIRVPAETPEANVKRQLDSLRRDLEAELPVFYLPFRGTWKVTQGIDGEFTHRGPWSHAWDFEVASAEGPTYRGSGSRPQDFLAYGMPVLAPGPGRVVRLRGDLPDSPVGQIRGGENWGNHVVLEHLGGIFSGVYHLAPGSLEVELGQQVRAGQVLGKVGSSGRSPVPHLHFQAQVGPEPGSPTLACELLHYSLETPGTRRYRTRGQPVLGDLVRPLKLSGEAAWTSTFPLGQANRFRVRQGSREWLETWSSEVDFLGRRSLWCPERGVRLTLGLDDHSLLTRSPPGPARSALAWLALGIPRLPFTDEEVEWSDRLPPEALLGALGRFGNDLLQPFLPSAHLESLSRLRSLGQSECLVETRLVPRGLLLEGRPEWRVRTRMRAGLGPVEMHVEHRGQSFLVASYLGPERQTA